LQSHHTIFLLSVPGADIDNKEVNNEISYKYVHDRGQPGPDMHGFADNYSNLAAQGYRWATVDGPYACTERM